MQKLQQQFGLVIKARRKAIELGQEALADKAGLHRTHVSLLERGQRMPSLLVIKKLAAGLDTTMADLMRELEQGVTDPAGEQPDARPVRKKRGRP